MATEWPSSTMKFRDRQRDFADLDVYVLRSLCPSATIACVDLETEFVRLWVSFDLSKVSADEADSSIIKLDGGPYWHRLLWRGVGVTGFDENDCLNLIAQAIAPHSLPPISSIESGVNVEKLGIDVARVAVPVWRGIWSPPLNIAGPTPF
jgi:hypothetical protein